MSQIYQTTASVSGARTGTATLLDDDKVTTWLPLVQIKRAITQSNFCNGICCMF